MTISRDDGSDATPTAANGEPAPQPSATTGMAVAHGRRAIFLFRSSLQSHRDELALMVPVAAYLALAGCLLMAGSGLFVGLLIAGLVAVFGRRVSADTMLALYRAEPIAPGQGGALRAAITSMSARAGLSAEPALAIVPSLAIGAFSVGMRPRMALLMTEGLLRRHTLPEIVARAAHEIAHMRAGDLPTLALADTVTRLAQALFYLGLALLVVAIFAWLGGENSVGLPAIAALLLAPTLASQLQLRLPRAREFAADRAAALLLGDIRPMIAAARGWEDDRGSWIDDLRLPVPQRRAPTPSPLRAHPPAADRVDRLQQLDAADLPPALAVPDEPLISLVGFGPIEMRARNRWPGLWF